MEVAYEGHLIVEKEIELPPGPITVSANATDDRISSQSRKSGAKRSLKLKALERRKLADSTIMK